jgi:ferredoxin
VGLFIEVRLQDPDTLDQGISKLLVSCCPVDIFKGDESKVRVDTDQEDECTLCELCLDIAPPGVVHIRKRYKDEELVSRGAHPSG